MVDLLFLANSQDQTGLDQVYGCSIGYFGSELVIFQFFVDFVGQVVLDKWLFLPQVHSGLSCTRNVSEIGIFTQCFVERVDFQATHVSDSFGCTFGSGNTMSQRPRCRSRQ